MAIDLRKPFLKQPSEEYDIDVDFGDVVPLGADKIVSGSITAKKWPRKQPNNKVATTEIVSSLIPVPVGKYTRKARIHVIGGIAGYDCQITVKATWDNGSKLEEEILVRVREE